MSSRHTPPQAIAAVFLFGAAFLANCAYPSTEHETCFYILEPIEPVDQMILFNKIEARYVGENDKWFVANSNMYMQDSCFADALIDVYEKYDVDYRLEQFELYSVDEEYYNKIRAQAAQIYIDE